MTMEKKTAAVIFGGQSSEHVVSCMSAANVIDRINTDKYNLILKVVEGGLCPGNQG